MSGKGSGRRPRLVPREQYDNNWDSVFGDVKRGDWSEIWPSDPAQGNEFPNGEDDDTDGSDSGAVGDPKQQP